MRKYFLSFLIVSSISLFGSYEKEQYWGSIGAGFLKPSDPYPALQIEARSKLLFTKFRPQLGFLTSKFGTVYLYGGVGFEQKIVGRLYFYPSFSPGIYFKGRHGRDLGSPVEFRSCLELFYQLNCKLRFGGNFFHLSNGSIASHNPGVNGTIFYVAFAFY